MDLIASIAELFFGGYLATRMARRYAAGRPPGRVGFALAWFLIFAACFFGSFFLLGLVNLLTGWPVVRTSFAALLNGLLALILLARGNRRVAGEAPTDHGFLREAREFWKGLDLPARVLCVSVAGTFVVLALLLCAEFPRGYEPKAYHLPIAGHVLQTHGLRPWDREYMDTLPANASIFYAYLLGFLPEHVISAANVLCLAPLLLALYALGGWTGADPSASLVAACGAATIPLVAFSCLETGADVAGLAFLGVAAYFALARRPLAAPDLLLSGLAAGLAFGFKSVHLVSIAFLLGVILVRRWRGEGSPSVSRSTLRAARGAGLFLAGVLVLSGVWLLRNWMEFRNPIYPIHVEPVAKAFGWAKAPDVDYAERRAFQFEWVRSPSEWFLYPWIEWHMHGENFKHSSGLGAFFAAMVPPALVTSLFGLGSRRGRERGVLLSLLAGCGLLFAVWWALGDRQPRYLMGGLVYGIPLVAWMIGQATGRRRRALGWLACGGAIFMLGVVLSSQGFEFGYRLLHLRQWTRHRYYGYPAAVDRLPAGSTVVNLVSRPQNWSLFGAKHVNRVVNSRRALRDLGAPPGEAPPAAVSLDAGVLRRLGATHIVALSRTKLQTNSEVALTELGHSEWRFAEPASVPVLYRLDYRDVRPGLALCSPRAQDVLHEPVNR